MVDLYDEEKQQTYIDTPSFIDFLKKDISNNLRTLIAEAQSIVYEGYQKFFSKDEVIKSSQFQEYIAHPNLSVNAHDGSLEKRVTNPFELSHPLRHENLTAYFDYYFDEFIRNDIPHEIYNLNTTTKVIEHLSLTSLIASAMQIIITEEMGINAYSLYNIKVHSNGHGHEFIQVDDNGSVQIRALKSRARNAQIRKAKGSIVELSKVSTQNIDAATCLKMALEMTSRVRSVTGMQELWLCISHLGVSAPTPETFQAKFKNIRNRLSLKKPALNNATLKKVRSSKGVLIFLNSNGDSLKAANYLGNTVKTTLNRYIPFYLKELIYRVKIRAFQNILLFMSVASDESPYNSMNINKDEFVHKVNEAFKNPEMGGNLYQSLTNPPTKTNEENTIFFCISEKNIELAIKYIKEGEDEELKNNCIAVINLISEGPVIMKEMLRKAQLAIEMQG